MSKRAEEKAREYEDSLDYYQHTSDEIDKFLFDLVGVLPGCCSSIESVKYTIARTVAEALWPKKDLALTINDLELLHTFLYAIKNNKQGCFTFTRLSDEQYEEVLRRFNEAKQ